MGPGEEDVVGRLTSLKQYNQQGNRAPHKPLLLLMAIGELLGTGSSELAFSEVEDRLGRLIKEYVPTSSSVRQTAAYPFWRLQNDQIWVLDRRCRRTVRGNLRVRPAGSRRRLSECCSTTLKRSRPLWQALLHSSSHRLCTMTSWLQSASIPLSMRQAQSEPRVAQKGVPSGGVASFRIGRRRVPSADSTHRWEARPSVSRLPTSGGSILTARITWTMGWRSARSTTSCSIGASWGSALSTRSMSPATTRRRVPEVKPCTTWSACV